MWLEFRDIIAPTAVHIDIVDIIIPDDIIVRITDIIDTVMNAAVEEVIVSVIVIIVATCADEMFTAVTVVGIVDNAERVDKILDEKRF